MTRALPNLHGSRLFACGCQILFAGHKRAQEAKGKADELHRRYEANEWQDNAQIDLQFSVQTCLAHCCHKVGLDQEALGIYNVVVRDAEYHMAGRLRVNIGNIYFQRQQWTDAIKQYRMALDQLPNERQVRRLSMHRACVWTHPRHLGMGFACCTNPLPRWSSHRTEPSQ